MICGFKSLYSPKLEAKKFAQLPCFVCTLFSKGLLNPKKSDVVEWSSPTGSRAPQNTQPSISVTGTLQGVHSPPSASPEL
jgi:hypothetical protein